MKKIKGFKVILILSLALCLLFSMSVYAMSRMELTTVTSPKGGLLHAEWNEYSGAAKYEVNFARKTTIEKGGAGKKTKISAKDNIGIEIETEYDNIDYVVRVRALDSKGKAISDWSKWETVFVLSKSSSSATPVSSASTLSGACSDETFASLQKSYEKAVMLQTQCAAVYQLPQVPANADIENCINTSADAINQAGNLNQAEMSEGDARELRNNLEELSTALLDVYKLMATYVQ